MHIISKSFIDIYLSLCIQKDTIFYIFYQKTGVAEITENFPICIPESMNNEKISPYEVNRKSKHSETNVNMKENVYDINDMNNVNNVNDDNYVDTTGVHCLALLWRFSTKLLDQARSILSPKVSVNINMYIHM
jgi:hypothetical protein